MTTPTAPFDPEHQALVTKETPQGFGLITANAPELADLTLAQVKKRKRIEYLLAGILLASEAFLAASLLGDAIARGMPDFRDVSAWVGAFVALAFVLAAYLAAVAAGEASRRSQNAMIAWLVVVAVLGAMMFVARIMHQEASPHVVEAGTQSLGAASATGAQNAAIENKLMALLLLAIFLATASLGVRAGRFLHHPRLSQLLEAREQRAALLERWKAEQKMLVLLRGNLAEVETAMARLPAFRDESLRETYDMVYAASHVARLRIAELLGRPDATSITRYEPDFGPLPRDIARIIGVKEPATDATQS
ncbi:MAG TPA: hypothetical protein PLL54_00190 [Dermatophilaceae bacterium]|nr:hypothetical protein [Dermatophilaceae bacterium]